MTEIQNGVEIKRPAVLISQDKIKVPLPLALGHYEKLTDEELDDHLCDILHERDRRTPDSA